MSAPENRQASAEGAGKAPGRRLAEARESQHQSPADIARQLKLSVAQVEALESGRFERLPGPIFVRGFIRNYARLMRLDPDDLLSAADPAVPRTAPPPDRPPPQDIPYPVQARRRWPLAVAALSIIAALAAYEMYWDDAAPVPAPSETPKTSRAPAVPQANAPATGEAGNVPGPMAVAQNESETAAEPAVENESAATGPREGAAGDLPGPKTAQKAGEKRVTLEFGEESWVEIRDRNERVIFSQLNRPGTQQLVDGLPPFSVVVGNAQAVRLTYDGKSVDLGPHTRLDVARLILQ
jgi:cytoskeleton protein RodZ